MRSRAHKGTVRTRKVFRGSFGPERLEERSLLSADPVATLFGVPSDPLLGEAFAFTARFDNAGLNVGYGPYVDLFLPATGADGDDGVDFAGATYLGVPVVATPFTFQTDSNNNNIPDIAHPYARTVAGAPLVGDAPAGFGVGDKLVVLELPFGSFTVSQPATDIRVSVTLSNFADLNTPLTLLAQGGFRYGNDPLDNPAADPSLVGATVNQAVRPALYRLTKTYVGPEDETATGPNFPRRYIVTADIADGQTLTNLDLTDSLPNNLQFLRVVDTRAGGASVGTTAINTPDGLPEPLTPGGTLTLRFDSVTGGPGSADAEMEYEVFVPLDDSTGTPVLDAASGDDAPAIDDASASGTWTPLDNRDPQMTASSDATAEDHVLTAKAIAIQKSVRVVVDTGAVGPSPGDTLEYTLDFQVSDYFAFGNVVVDDLFSDGQVLTDAPTLCIDEHGSVTKAPFDAANFTLTSDVADPAEAPGTNGGDRIVFRVSDEMVLRGGVFADGLLVGGAIPDGGTVTSRPPSYFPFPFGATHGLIVFRTTILDAFTHDFPSGDPSVDQGDVLSNKVTIRGDLLNVTDLTPNGNSEDDTSAANVSIVRGSLTKTIYAINGVVGSYPSRVEVAPGDVVTYRLTATLPASDVESLAFVDFLPLPVFTAGEVTTFDAMIDATAPVAGHAQFGPADTFFAISGRTPTLLGDATGNSLRFDFGSYDDPQNRSSTVDLLLSVTVSDEPFADQLYLTNQIRQEEASTFQEPATEDAIIQITLTEPEISRIRKGVVATSNAAGTFAPALSSPQPFSVPGSAGVRFTGVISSDGLAATPIDSNLSGVDAGDLVTFAIVVENTGSSRLGAFDLRLRDALPSGFAVPAGGRNLTVSDGAGAVFPFTDLGSGLFDPVGGIEIDDPGATPAQIDGTGGGALDGYHATSGRNILIVTYDLVAVDTVAPRQAITNAATLTNYANTESGPNFIPDGLIDGATVTIADPTAVKTLTGTSIDDATNGAAQAVVGEIATYSLVVTVPEGELPTTRIVDTLPAGLAFVDVVSFAMSSGVTTANAITTGANPNNTTVGAGGQTVTFDLGLVTNTDRDNAQADTITLVYRAAVLDVATNQEGNTLTNGAVVSWNSGAMSLAAATADLTVIEPEIQVTHAVAVNGNSGGDAGDPVVYTITLTNPNSGSTTAYDVTLSDPLPTELLGATITGVTGAALAAFEINGATVQTTSPLTSMLPGEVIVITISGTLASSVYPGQSIAATATTTWTSLPGAPAAASTHNATSVERTGAGGVDDYTANAVATFTVDAPSLTKSLENSSEPTTTGNQAAIGEVVRFRLIAQIPEGTSPNLQLRDNLPGGLTFLDDGTAFVAFVSNGDGLSSSLLLSDPTLDFIGDSGAVTPTYLLPDDSVSSSSTADDDTYSSGTDVFFKIGDIVNADDDADGEFVVIEFNALTANVASNTAGTTLNNTFSTLIQPGATLQAVGTPSNDATVTIVEPSISDLQLSVVGSAAVDAGDAVVFRVNFSNASAANSTTAFDVPITVPMPTNLVLDPTSVVVRRNGSVVVSGFSDVSTPSGLDIVFDDLAPGDAIEIDFVATVQAGAVPGEDLTTTANLTYTSLPGAGGTSSADPNNTTGSETPGIPGSVSGERDGSGTAPNTYLDSSPVPLTVAAPVLVKSLTATSLADTQAASVAIGEIVTYRLTVTLPEGSTPSLVLDDLLPSGLGYVANSATVIPGVFNGTLPTPTVSGSVTLTFGPISVVNDNDSANNSFDVEFQALVLDVPGNVGFGATPTTLDNSATVTIGAASGTSGTVTVTVVEPSLALTKDIDLVRGDAGDTVTIALTLRNDGPAAAYDVAVADNLPAGKFVTVSPLSTPSGFTFGLSGDRVTYTGGSLDAGASVTFTFQANLAAAVVPGETIDNTASATATTLPGLDPNERTEPDASGNDSLLVNGSGLSGVIYSDTNDNGVYEPGVDMLLAGPTIRLNLNGVDHLGNVVDVILTTTDGTYAFTGLRPSDAAGYTLTQLDQPAGFLDSRETPGDIGNAFGGTVGPVGSDAITGIVIPLGSNQDEPNYNFGEVQSAQVGDSVWYDTNGNGVRDLAESGIANVSVDLTWAGPDGSLGTADDNTFGTTTDANGFYAIADLPPGSYRVDISGLPGGVLVPTFDPDGAGTPHTATFSVVPGADRSDIDFGYLSGTSFVGDTVWYDVDGNGTQNHAEPGIAGVTVTLTYAGLDAVFDTPDDTAVSTTTDAMGHYSFTGLAAVAGETNNYRATLSNIPAEYLAATFDRDGAGTANTAIFTLGVGGVRNDVDFGLRGDPGTGLGDCVWFDGNGDGVFDSTSESGIVGIVVELYDATGTNLLATTTTDSNGIYHFDGLTEGTYRVRFIGVANGVTYRFSPPLQGGDVALDSDADPATGFSGPATVVVFNFNGDVDAGLNLPAAVGGRIWYDVDGDGTRQPGEPGVGGVTVALTWAGPDGQLDTADDQLFVATTAADGSYAVANAPAGRYRAATANLPSGLTQPTYDLDDVVTPDVALFDVPGGAGRTDVDFGYRGTASLGDFVWFDADGDGVQDVGEPGLEGVRVTLIWHGQDGVPNSSDIAYPVATTDAQGNYLFADLPSGAFTVAVDAASVPAGFALGSDPDGGGDGSASALVAPGGATLDADFSYTGTASLGNTVWYDADGDGLRGPRESGIANVSVMLTWAGFDGTFATADDGTFGATTDANGFYAIAGLPPGSYRADVAGLPGGEIEPTSDPDGAATPHTATFDLLAGADRLDIDFGYRNRTVTVGGRLWYDVDGDGTRQPGEPGVGGATVALTWAGPDDQLDSADDQLFIAMTAADGSYSVMNAPVGRYRAATANLPLGLTQPTYDLDGIATPDVALFDAPADVGRTDIDFGYLGTAALGDRVWFDADADGVQDADEPGLSGVRLTLLWRGQDNVPSGDDVVYPAMTTDVLGTYSFTALPSGTFVVAVDGASVPAGFLLSGDPDGGGDGSAAVLVAPGGSAPDADFGYTGTGSLGDTVWFDVNANGAFAMGEPGVPAATVAVTWAGIDGLFATLDDFTATVPTDADGRYSVAHLPPGSYRVAVSAAPGLPGTRPTFDLDGGEDGTTFVALAEGESRSDVDFGVTGSSSLRGTVFVDEDGDGFPGASEPGVAGVTLTLTGTNAFGPIAPVTAMTNAAGSYRFLNLLQGVYAIAEAQPPQYADGPDFAGSEGGTAGDDQITDIPLGADEAANGYDFTEAGVSLSGVVFLDVNRNGVRDAGEPGLGGVVVSVRDGNGVVLSTIGTFADGSYHFNNLPAGDYRVVEAQPAAYSSTTPDDVAVTLPPTGLSGVNFGERGGSLSGEVYLDIDGDSTRDAGEPGLTGVAVMLTGTAADGAAVNRTATTGAGGSFHFADLPAGNYTLQETQPSGLGDGSDAAGSAGGSVGDDVVSGVVLSPGVDATGYRFGERSAANAALAGVVFVDADRDGTRDPEEVGLGGALLTLRDSLGNIVADTTSAADGSYFFTNLPPGQYRVVQARPAGYGASTADTRDVAIPAEGVTGVDFGATLASLAGSVFVDLNGDGVRDAGEPGLGGVALALAGTDANGTPVTRNTMTSADGSYVFDNLLSGTYTISEMQPSGFDDGQDAAGSSGGAAGNDTVSAIALGAGIAGTGYTFAEALPAGQTFVSGTVFVDADRDGVRDVGESGLANVVLTLRDGSGNPIATATTDANGSYVFTGIAPGPYTLDETQPTGYGSSTADNRALNVTADGLVDQDFGETAASLSGSVYVDANGNGTRDISESGIGGVALLLTGGGVTRAATTAADGSYRFDHLLSGTYTLHEIQPFSYLDQAETVGTLGGSAALNDAVSAIAVGAGQVGSGYDFGESSAPPATIAGAVFIDLNGDGARQANEPGIDGVAVELLGGAGAILGTSVTALDGSFVFDGLPAGTYSVRELQPFDFDDGTDSAGATSGSVADDLVSDIVLGAGTSATGIVFGERMRPSTGSVRGVVFVDANGDGVAGPGEAGVPGVIVVLVDATGATVDAALTDATGRYFFPNLAPDHYFASLAGVVGFGNANATSPDLEVLPGGGAGHDFALTLGSLSGFVYTDTSTNAAHVNDGVRQANESEVGLAGVVLTLIGTDAAGAPVMRTTTTAADGSYSFDGLKSGTYTIRESQPANIYDGKEAATATANDVYAATALAAGTSLSGFDFGELPPADPNGYVFRDDNNNGVRDPGEVGIPGVTIRFTGFAIDPNDANNVLYVDQTMVTDANGFYAFVPIPASAPGRIDPVSGREGYTLTETQPAGFADGREQNGTPPAGVVNNDQFGNLVLSFGVLGSDYNFGELASGSLAGSVYVDQNGNGVRDAGEPGIANIAVTLTGSDVTGATVNRSATTATDGSYTFANVFAGTYTIHEGAVSGFFDGAEAVGTQGGSASANDELTVTLGPGVVGTGNTFGEVLFGPSTGVEDAFLTTPAAGTGTMMTPRVLSKGELLGSSSNGGATTLTDSTIFLNQLYQDVLGRTPDQQGLDDWASRLRSGTSRADVALAFWRSAEHRAQQVERFYQTFLRRAADEGGRAAFVALFLAGADETRVASVFLASDEYRSTHATDDDFVVGLYADVLSRAPDDGGRAYLIGLLRNGTSRADVATAVLRSSEAAGRLVDRLYRDDLHRDADAAGRAFWTSLLANAGLSCAEVAALILAQDEYLRRA